MIRPQRKPFPGMENSCECVEKTFTDFDHRVVFCLGVWVSSEQPLGLWNIKSQESVNDRLVEEIYTNL
jgi:hypothetical protein